MKLKRLSVAIISTCAMIAGNVNASTNGIWELTSRSVATNNEQTNVDAANGTLLLFDNNEFESKFRASSDSFYMPVPLPSGDFINLRFTENSVFAPSLAAKYPKIKSFEVFDENGQRLGRFSYSSKGLHGMFKHNGRYVLIDPKFKNNHSLYLSYYRADAKRLNDSNVISEDPELFEQIKKDLSLPSNAAKKHGNQLNAKITGDSIKTYRLAVAAAGDYTQFHGGTVESSLAALNVLLNRINEIYLVELAVQFELVADNDKIVFTDPETDPYTNENSDLAKNQETIDATIGSDNYDIGHLVNGAAGGVAIAAVCNSDFKAQGLTGSSEPTGDAFHVDYVAHEIGHQFGANHSYNGQEAGCNTRVAGAAVEPGSGSTIMGYATLCGSQDLQTNSDPSFHIRSIEEMRAFIEEGSASQCGTSASITNNAPVSEAGSDYTIPANTPFMLTGEGSDPDNDTISYIWEQRDANGRKTNSADEMVDNGSNPLFRTWTPQSNAIRYFPRLSDVLENKTTLGETYPNSTRTMNYYLTVKDSKGGVATDSMKLSTYSSTGFRISQPSATKGWISGVSNVLRWETANTDKAPVNCEKVNIDISSDGGETFDTLEHDVANDGLHVVTAPSSSGNNYRLKISCPDNVFFDVNRANFDVVQSSATDSDSDGIPDDVEDDNNLNKNDASDALADADGDGLTNLEEYLLGTNVNESDSDGDGIPDQYEVLNGLNPLDAEDATQDADGDGVSNRAEYNGQTDPMDPNSSVILTLTTFDFEQEGGLNGWTFDGDNAWSRDTSIGYESDASLGSNANGDNQSSVVSYAGDMTSGDVTFFYKTSTEQGFDKFSFSVDGDTVFEVSGEIDWTPFTYKVTAGSHTLTWTYTKDETASSGSDKVWIDNVSIPLNNGNSVDDGNGGGDGGTGGGDGGTGGGDSDRKVAYDYDGDGKADVAVRRPATFYQYVKNSSNNEVQRVVFGRDESDIPVSGDFDGDGKADVAVRRASNSFWYIKNSSNGEIQRIKFGLQEADIPVPADYDGDGITDVAVRRPSNQFWYIRNSSDGTIQRINFGKQEDDIPVPADYDGDGKADVAVRRANNQFWYIRNSSDGEIQRINFGKQEADIPVPADYDGDGKADVAVRRASNQFFYIRNSSDGTIQRINFGKDENDIPVVADYDGDGKADVAVRRASNQFFYIRNSSNDEIQRINFGRQEQDIPIAAPVATRMSMASGSDNETEQPELPSGVAGISGDISFTTANEGAPYELNQIASMSVSQTGVFTLDTNPSSNDGNEVTVESYTVSGTETRWEDSSAGYAYVLSVANGSINELNVFSLSDNTFLGQFTPYSAGGGVENLELVTQFAGTYNVEAITGTHNRGTLTISSDGSIDFDTSTIFASSGIVVIYDRTFIEDEPRVQINYGEDDDGQVINLFLKTDLSGPDTIQFRYNSANYEVTLRVL